MNDKKRKVLYVAGCGRSGTTLLDVILGQVPGFFPVGEVCYVWDYGLRDNYLCGCGQRMLQCPTWQEVFSSEFSGDRAVDPAQIVRWRERFARTKRLVPMAVRGRRYTQDPRSGIRNYLDILERLYNAVFRVTGASTVVDSSKWPMYAFLLDSLPSIDLHVLHLVRDPRACAFSWLRKKEIDPGRFMAIQGPLKSTAYWAAWNPAIRHFFKHRKDRYMFLRYEDFVAEPRRYTEDILRFVGEEGASLPFVADHRVRLAPTHTVYGNPNRHQLGEVEIRADEQWRESMPWRKRALVTAMTWPFLWQYGYWTRPPRES